MKRAAPKTKEDDEIEAAVIEALAGAIKHPEDTARLLCAARAAREHMMAERRKRYRGGGRAELGAVAR